MSGKRTKWVVLFALAGLVAVALLRAAYVQLATFGEGAYETSPDGQYVAEFWSYYGKKYFGGNRYWAEFEIQDAGGDVIWTHGIEGNQADLAIRAGGDVSWSGDSKSVTFSAPTKLGTDFALTVSADDEQFQIE